MPRDYLTSGYSAPLLRKYDSICGNYRDSLDEDESLRVAVMAIRALAVTISPIVYDECSTFVQGYCQKLRDWTI